jgi:TorA maturation chaperone TorD
MVEIYRDLAGYRSNLYGLLSSVYIQIPDGKTLAIDWEPASKLFEFPTEGAKEVQKEIGKGLRLIGDYVSKKDLHPEKCLINLSKDWTGLFRGVNAKGLPPPYESVYRIGRLQEKPSQEIHRLFAKKGIRIPEEWHQPPDYIGVELDLMRFLCKKEQETWERKRLDSVYEVLEEENSFLENHLGLWISIFCEKMAKEAHEDFFKGIARLTTGLVGYDQVWVPHLFDLIHSGRGER